MGRASFPPMPRPLMLATLTDRRDFGDDWLLERKFDGERCVACKTGHEVRLESRTGTNLTDTYPEVRAAVSAPTSPSTSTRRRDRRIRRGADVILPPAAAIRGSGAFVRPTAYSTCSSSTVRIASRRLSHRTEVAIELRGRSGSRGSKRFVIAWLH